MPSKLNIEFKNKLVRYFFGGLLGDLGTKIIEAKVFGKHRNVVLDENGENKMSEKVTNEEVLERIGKNRTFLNNIVRRKANEICHILRRNCLLHDAIEGQMT